MIHLTYQLTLCEPVLVTAPGGDPNTDLSLDYIPGSVIRGALAAHYLQNSPEEETAFLRLFLDGSTRFLNAYPAYQVERTLPVPQHWARAKDQEDNKAIYSLLDKNNGIATKSMGGQFMAIDANNVVHTVLPSHEIAVHHARNRQMGRAILNDGTNRSALFRYHALAEGQSFIGQIWTSQEDAKILRPFLNGTLLLGGSRTAGYGLTQITLKPDQKERELGIYPTQPIEPQISFLVYLTSDAIVRNPETGQPGLYLLQALATLLPGHQLEVMEVFGRLTWVGGFNVKWGLPLPQTYALPKGSVWQIQSNQLITADDIKRIEQAGIGDRRAEGFGTLLINPPFATPLQVPESSPECEKRVAPKCEENVAPTLTTETETPFAQKQQKEAEDMWQKMNERMVRQILDRHLAAVVNTLHKEKQVNIRLSNSQLARIRLRVRQERGKPLHKFADFKRYLEGTAERKTADEWFRKSHLEGQNFRNWLLSLVNQPSVVWQKLNLGEHNWSLTDSLAHEYTIRLIDAVCELVNKSRRGE